MPVRIPRLPAAARKAGATQIDRCSANVFVVGFKLHGDDLSQPGHGAAVFAALQAWAGEAFTVEWKGEQRYGIIITAR